MQRKQWMVFIGVTVMAVMLFSGIAQAQDKMATLAQAREFHKKVAAFAKEVGCDKFIAEINNTKSKYNTTYKNVYPQAHDLNGVVLGNGHNPYLVGQNHMGLKDAEGKPFVRNVMDAIKKSNHVETEYKWLDSKTKKIDKRLVMTDLIDCGARGKMTVSDTLEGRE